MKFGYYFKMIYFLYILVASKVCIYCQVEAQKNFPQFFLNDKNTTVTCQDLSGSVDQVDRIVIRYAPSFGNPCRCNFTVHNNPGVSPTLQVSYYDRSRDSSDNITKKNWVMFKESTHPRLDGEKQLFLINVGKDDIQVMGNVTQYRHVTSHYDVSMKVSGHTKFAVQCKGNSQNPETVKKMTVFPTTNGEAPDETWQLLITVSCSISVLLVLSVAAVVLYKKFRNRKQRPQPEGTSSAHPPTRSEADARFIQPMESLPSDYLTNTHQPDREQSFTAQNSRDPNTYVNAGPPLGRSTLNVASGEPQLYVNVSYSATDHAESPGYDDVYVVAFGGENLLYSNAQ